MHTTRFIKPLHDPLWVGGHPMQTSTHGQREWHLKSQLGRPPQEASREKATGDSTKKNHARKSTHTQTRNHTTSIPSHSADTTFFGSSPPPPLPRPPRLRHRVEGDKFIITPSRIHSTRVAVQGRTHSSSSRSWLSRAPSRSISSWHR